MPGDSLVAPILGDAVTRAGIAQLPADLRFPLIVRTGVNGRGRALHYLLNYSAASQTMAYPFPAGMELLSGKSRSHGTRVDLPPWGVEIVEEAETFNRR
jgi:beta-galactosidase